MDRDTAKVFFDHFGLREHYIPQNILFIGKQGTSQTTVLNLDEMTATDLKKYLEYLKSRED